VQNGQVIAIVLSLVASVSWGTGDFFGGLIARRMATFVAVSCSLTFGGVLLLAALLVGQVHFDLSTFMWGAAAGTFGGFGLVLFYRALAIGSMSIVAPISGCGSALPAAIDIARGNIPSALVLVGLACIIVGVVLSSAEPVSEGQPSGFRVKGVTEALAAAVCFGLFLTLVDHAVTGGDTFEALWSVVGARAGSVVTIVPIALWMVVRSRAHMPSKHLAGALLLVALFDTTANGLYAISTLHGQLAVVGVLASMYPVTTVLLATVALGERLARHQLVGVVLAFAGIGALSAG
jgi:drug/metabolite transporter (DMT)-like permease